MHDLLDFEGYIPIRHACYYDGKQSKWKKKARRHNMSYW